MPLRRVDTAPDLIEAVVLASQWSESPHQPSLSEATRLQLREGRGTGFVSDDPSGVVTLTATKWPEMAMVEIAVPPSDAASHVWDAAEPAVVSAARERGFRALELLTWDTALQSRLREQGWTVARSIKRGSMEAAPLPASGGTYPNVASLLGGETDLDQLIEVYNLAFADHPDAGEWDRAELDKLFSEPWFDRRGLLVDRTAELLTGFCWTKVHPDGVGEIYLLAVRPGHSGRGLGRKLAITGVDYLKVERACPEVIIYWDASNETTDNLYQSIGFSVDRLGEVFQLRL
ncbi:MAG TPA: GNAT family N-acetyltransferase [Acidimicrobiia bacterium]